MVRDAAAVDVHVDEDIPAVVAADGEKTVVVDAAVAVISVAVVVYVVLADVAAEVNFNVAAAVAGITLVQI